MAGAAFGEIWVDSRSEKCCNFQYNMRLRSAKSNLGERAGEMTSSWSDHARIMVESSAQCKSRFVRFQQIPFRFWSAILRGRRSIW